MVVRKGAADAVGDGQQLVVCEEEGSPRRAGGQVWGAAWASRGMPDLEGEFCLQHWLQRHAHHATCAASSHH